MPRGVQTVVGDGPLGVHVEAVSPGPQPADPARDDDGAVAVLHEAEVAGHAGVGRGGEDGLGEADRGRGICKKCRSNWLVLVYRFKASYF